MITAKSSEHERPLTLSGPSHLLQAIEICALVYDVQAFTDHMATLQACKGQKRPQAAIHNPFKATGDLKMGNCIILTYLLGSFLGYCFDKKGLGSGDILYKIGCEIIQHTVGHIDKIE
jgi:hypothetical protein